MKKLRGFSAIWVIAVMAIVVLLGVVTYLIIDGQNKAINYQDFDTTAIIEEGDYNGNIAEHVMGNANAPVIITEYANFQCSHCATMYPIVKQTVADMGDQIGLIFRNVTWSSFPNSKAAAAAAEAAGLQGYWQQYADLLFENQAEWSSATGSERSALFDKYFEEASDGQGDLEQFNRDISSEAVAQKIKFDLGISKEAGVEGTPAFYVNGQFIDMTNGGQITLKNGKTVSYDGFTSNADFTKLLQDIVATQAGE